MDLTLVESGSPGEEFIGEEIGEPILGDICSEARSFVDAYSFIDTLSRKDEPSLRYGAGREVCVILDELVNPVDGLRVEPVGGGGGETSSSSPLL